MRRLNKTTTSLINQLLHANWILNWNSQYFTHAAAEVDTWWFRILILKMWPCDQCCWSLCLLRLCHRDITWSPDRVSTQTDSYCYNHHIIQLTSYKIHDLALQLTVIILCDLLHLKVFIVLSAIVKHKHHVIVTFLALFHLSFIPCLIVGFKYEYFSLNTM